MGLARDIGVGWEERLEIEAASSHTRVLSERTSQTGHSVRTPASGMCPSQGWECRPQEPA